MTTEEGGVPDAERTRHAHESLSGGVVGQESKARSIPKSRLAIRWPWPLRDTLMLIHRSTAAFTVRQPPIMA